MNIHQEQQAQKTRRKIVVKHCLKAERIPD